MLWSAQHHLLSHPFLLRRLTFLDLPLLTNIASWLVSFCILLAVPLFVAFISFFSLYTLQQFLDTVLEIR